MRPRPLPASLTSRDSLIPLLPPPSQVSLLGSSVEALAIKVGVECTSSDQKVYLGKTADAHQCAVMSILSTNGKAKFLSYGTTTWASHMCWVVSAECDATQTTKKHFSRTSRHFNLYTLTHTLVVPNQGNSKAAEGIGVQIRRSLEDKVRRLTVQIDSKDADISSFRRKVKVLQQKLGSLSTPDCNTHRDRAVGLEAHGDPTLPKGSYTSTCHSCKLVQPEDLLECRCTTVKSGHAVAHVTQLSGFSQRTVKFCRDILNQDGKLTCVGLILPGDYRKMCSSCKYMVSRGRSVLQCECEYEDDEGAKRSKLTRLSRPLDCFHVGSLTGDLICNKWTKVNSTSLVLMGNYGALCRSCDLAVDGELNCECPRPDKTYKWTVLQHALLCHEVNSINGTLVCEMGTGADSKHAGSFDVMELHSHAAGNIPEGSYMHTCHFCHILHDELQCMCDVESTSETTATEKARLIGIPSRSLRYCRNIENRNGELFCSGMQPPGNYRESCHKCKLALGRFASKLMCWCRVDLHGKEQQSSLINPLHCFHISSEEGVLTCNKWDKALTLTGAYKHECDNCLLRKDSSLECECPKSDHKVLKSSLPEALICRSVVTKDGRLFCVENAKLSKTLQKYDKWRQSCVKGSILEGFVGKTVEECAALCEQAHQCVAFEYGVWYGGTNTDFPPRHCGLRDRVEREKCDGALQNVDLYIRQETALRSIASREALEEIVPEWNVKGQIWQQKIAEIWDKQKFIEEAKRDTSTGFSMCMPVLCSYTCSDATLLHLEEDMVGTRCCRSVLQFLLRQVTRILVEVGLPYMISHGTLLGAVREAGIIGWTRDIDLTVPEQALAFFSTEFGRQTLGTAGLVSFRDPAEYDNVRVCIASGNKLFAPDPAASRTQPFDARFNYLDVHGSRVTKESFRIPTTSLVVPTKSVFPGQQCAIHEFAYPCPSASEVMLTQQYGKAWPLPATTHPSDEAAAFLARQSSATDALELDEVLTEMIRNGSVT